MSSSYACGLPARQDDHGAAERARTALYEDDIDAILERAEVVDSRQLAAAVGGAAAGGDGDGEGGGPAELLSSFNVATFKHEEDDATFWSKLIAPSERPKEEEVRPRYNAGRCVRPAEMLFCAV